MEAHGERQAGQFSGHARCRRPRARLVGRDYVLDRGLTHMKRQRGRLTNRVASGIAHSGRDDMRAAVYGSDDKLHLTVVLRLAEATSIST